MSTLTFSLVQTNLHWENKEANLAMLQQKIFSIKEKTEIVVLPEMFSTGFSMKPEVFAEEMGGPTIEWMAETAKQKRVVVAGSIMAKDGDDFYNRLVWMLPNGQYGYYDKRHRFAYAGEDEHYTSGNKRLISSVKGWRIHLQVCYDLRFPVWARQQSTAEEPEYDVLLYVANWPERRNHAWKTLLQARAIENQCYVVAVNRVGDDGNDIYHSGDSMVVDPLGNILCTKAHGEDILTVTLEKEKLDEIRRKFPFWKDADSFKITYE